MKYLHLYLKRIDCFELYPHCDRKIILQIKIDNNEYEIYAKHFEWKLPNEQYQTIINPALHKSIKIYSEDENKFPLVISNLKDIQVMGRFEISSPRRDYNIFTYLMIYPKNDFKINFLLVKYDYDGINSFISPLYNNIFKNFNAFFPYNYWGNELNEDFEHYSNDHICFSNIHECLNELTLWNSTFEGKNIFDSSNYLKSHLYYTREIIYNLCYLKGLYYYHEDSILKDSLALENYTFCENVQCLNEGICILDNIHAKFICKCKEGFFGSKCDYKFNCELCLNSECDSDGKCLRCHIGFEGDYCETKTCKNINMCGNHGRCIVKDSSRFCKCNNGWKGNYCNIKTCNKYPNKCNDNGICIIKEGDHACECNPGWGGKNCTEVSCNKIACGIHGKCVIKHKKIFCECEEGWTGEKCTYKICQKNEDCDYPDVCIKKRKQNICQESKNINKIA